MAPKVSAPHVAYEDAFLTTPQNLDASQQRLKILLAEDNAINRLLAQRILQKLGHEVTVANNGREALERWAQHQSSQFDVILMDVQMPEMDGLQAAACIREKEIESGAHIPIIAVTAHAMKGDRERCLAAGMDGYISKPIKPGELAHAIQTTIPTGLKSVAAPLDSLQGPTSDAELLARFDGDGNLLKELAGIFLQECPKMLDELREAVRTGDAARLERGAHALKGSVGNFAVSGPWETAQRLELVGKSGQMAGAEAIFRVLEKQFAQFNQTLARATAETALIELG
jgi:two-component system, sensor histidine kinase and response regulator